MYLHIRLASEKKYLYYFILFGLDRYTLCNAREDIVDAKMPKMSLFIDNKIIF